MKILFLLLAFSESRSFAWNEKLSQALVNSLNQGQRKNIFVSFANTTNLLEKLAFQLGTMSHGNKSVAVVNALKRHATASQSPLLGLVSTRTQFAPKIKSFWITNQMYIEEADAELVADIEKIKEVEAIEEEIFIQLDSLTSHDFNAAHVKQSWGGKKIQVEEAWSVLGKGENAVVGIIDTGARVTHEAIRENYLNGRNSWYDPYDHSPQPQDDFGHGTHVTATILGKIGMAPEAKWIACKGLKIFGSQSALLACGQFMLCPSESTGSSTDCGTVPHLVSSSWGSRNTGLDFYDGVISAWHAADIVPIFSAGNSGPSCGTIGYPADSKARVLTVAASNANDKIAGFSARGPSFYPAAHKPDVTAPDVEILSAGASSDDEYVTLSGTSIAAPHVVGVIALLKSHSPHVTFDLIAQTLQSTSDRNVTFAEDKCDVNGGVKFPNFTFGYGRINALAAAKAVK